MLFRVLIFLLTFPTITSTTVADDASPEKSFEKQLAIINLNLKNVDPAEIPAVKLPDYLMLAISLGNAEAVAKFLQRNLDLNQRYQGETPLTFAAYTKPRNP